MMLGVRRTSITAAAGALQRAGLIRYKHGNVTIIDRRGLIRRSCKCYSISKKDSIVCSAIEQQAKVRSDGMSCCSTPKRIHR